MDDYLAVLMAIIASVFGASGGFFLKKFSSRPGKIPFYFLNKSFILGLLSLGISAVLHFFALSLGELSVVYPASSFTYVWSVLIANFVLKEKINDKKIIGIGLIVLGVFLVTR